MNTKIELHCHLDGSLSKELMEELLGKEVARSEIEVPDTCESLAEYLQKFDLPLSLLQDEEGLKKAGFDVMRTAHNENVKYIEIRFAPILSTEKGLSSNKVIEALISGCNKAKAEFDMDYGLITCAMRHHKDEDSIEMLKAAREYLGSGVVACDSAGGEVGTKPTDYAEVFAFAKKLDFPFTYHAGEQGSASNVREAVELGARRIGHGIAMSGHKDIINLVREHRIGIEMCPISNVQTKAVPNISTYPMKEFINENLLVTINTDNRTVSNTSITKEIDFVQRNLGISDEEIVLMQKNAIEAAFCDESIKHKLFKQI